MNIPWDTIRKVFEHAVREARGKTLPLLSRGGEKLLGDDSTHDVVAAIDRASGEVIEAYLTEHCPVPCALMKEEGGAFEELHPNPVIRIITDEFDGTRGARMGIPTCGVCLAAYPVESEHKLRDVKVGAIASFTDELFSFVRGSGIWRDGKPWRPDAPPPDMERLRYLYDTNFGFPALTGLYLKDFNSSHRYGVLSIVSSMYSTRTMLLGGADFYINPNIRLERMWPELESHMKDVHRGAIGEYPWDLAANVPLLWEAGYEATHTDGSSLEDASLVDGSYDNIHDLLASRNRAVHERVIEALARQEKRLLADRNTVVSLLLDHGR